MSLREGPFGDLRVPITWTAGLAVILAIAGSIAFLVMDHRETARPSPLDPVRRVADSVLAPVSGVLATPVRWAEGAISFVGSYWDAANENRRLRAEIAELRQTRDMAVALRATNERYEALLGLRTEPEIQMVTARSISDARGPFANTRLVDAGRDRGIDIGNPVLSDRGLVGRIVGVGAHVSRILLLSDVASRVPVMLNRTNARAVLTGDGGANPRLSYLRTRDPVRAGDLIVTSGDGGVFPRGLTVGVAVRGMDGNWRAVLASDAAPIDFVKILLFRDFSQLLGARDITSTHMPSPVTEDPRARAGTGYTFSSLPQAAAPSPVPTSAATPPAAAAAAPAPAAAPRAATPTPPVAAAAPPRATPASPTAPALTTARPAAAATPATPRTATPRAARPVASTPASRPATARTRSTDTPSTTGLSTAPSTPTTRPRAASTTGSHATTARERPARARPAATPRPHTDEPATGTLRTAPTPPEPPF